MLDLQELKSKYPLAFDTIKLPVRYEREDQMLWTGDNQRLADLRGWGYIQKLSDPEQRQDQIGELIAHLLNQLQ